MDDSLILISKNFHLLLKSQSSWICIFCASSATLVTEHYIYKLKVERNFFLLYWSKRMLENCLFSYFFFPYAIISLCVLKWWLHNLGKKLWVYLCGFVWRLKVRDSESHKRSLFYPKHYESVEVDYPRSENSLRTVEGFQLHIRQRDLFWASIEVMAHLLG